MTYLITGSTGLIGAALVKTLAARGGAVIVAARNVGKARSMFAALNGIEIVEWDVVHPFGDGAVSRPIDFIVHAAAETASRNMVEHPVETMAVTIDGTRNALELARRLAVRGMVYLSSMEVYGSPQRDAVLDESSLGPLDHLAPRSSYPLSKRMAEGLCAAYAREYGVPVRIARLAQVIGEEIPKGDSRVIAQFARAIARGENIVLHTDGSSARCYCALSDAVDAVLFLLERGNPGEAYNVADASSYRSIRALAETLCAAHPPSRVVMEPAEGMGYAPSCKLRLSTAKLEALGWQPRADILATFERLIGSYREG